MGDPDFELTLTSLLDPTFLVDPALLASSHRRVLRLALEAAGYYMTVSRAVRKFGLTATSLP